MWIMCWRCSRECEVIKDRVLLRGHAHWPPFRQESVLARNYEWNCVYLENKLLLMSINFTLKTSHSCLKEFGTLGFPGRLNFVHLKRSVCIFSNLAPQCGSKKWLKCPSKHVVSVQSLQNKTITTAQPKHQKKTGKRAYCSKGWNPKEPYQQVAAQFLRLLVFSDAKLGGPLSVMSGHLRFSRKSSTRFGFDVLWSWISPIKTKDPSHFFSSCAGFRFPKKINCKLGSVFFLSGRICLFQKGFVTVVTQIAILSFTLPETNKSIWK